jgi:chromosome segregation ATPase
VRHPKELEDLEMTDDMQNLRDRLTKQGEEALGKLAQDLLENPLVSGAITRAFEARERAVAAQEAAMGALNIPSAADVERLTRRLRSVAQRLEGIEDSLDRLDRRLESVSAKAPESGAGSGDGLAAIEEALAKLTNEVRALASALDAAPPPVHREQERLQVDDEPAAKAPAKKAPAKKAAAKKPAAKSPGVGRAK